MTLLNVSFGVYAFLPHGWIFMLFVICIECLLLSKFLNGKWTNKRIYATVILSNIISGIIGMAISLMLNGGWWLIVWFPWVSSYEVAGTEAFLALLVYYLCAYVITILLETLFNWLLLRKEYPSKKIFTSTLSVNTISYIIGSIVLYSYSFS